MQELWEGDMALTVAKSLPAGLHLYNTITGETLVYKKTSKRMEDDLQTQLTTL